MSQDQDKRILSVPAIVSQEGSSQTETIGTRQHLVSDDENLPCKLYLFCKLWCQRLLGKDVKGDPLQAEEEG